MAQTYQIQVMRPMQRRGETRRFPVVYATDGNAVFDLFKGLSWLVQAYRQDAPAFILVAIGYPGDSPVTGEILRGRDLTFPGCPNWFDGFEMPWEGVAAPENNTNGFGGAEDFQRFIGEELIPYIDEHYETVPGDRTYFGHSVGGAFGLFTLFTQAQLFNNYILSSPALAYHGETAAGVHYDANDFMLERAREFTTSGRSLTGIRLYMSVGTEEELEPLIANWHFTSSFYRMTALLRMAAIPDLNLMTEVFAGETHATVWPMAFMHGIQAVFATGAWRGKHL
ncbi:MAG: alpha/beta hydrolase [Steroidobacteraceae bacterium]